MKYYIVTIESYVKSFAMIDNGGSELIFSYKSSANQEIFKNLSVDDSVLIYRKDPIKKIEMGMTVTAVSNDTINLKKVFEVNKGVCPNVEIVDTLESNEITEIQAENYEEYVSELFKISKSTSLKGGFHSSTSAKAGYNKIYYGCPGCGKSHLVQKELEDNKVPESDIFRVTFHPEYSNFDFVGQVMPTAETKTNPDGTTIDVVKYKFQAGPFTLALKRAKETESMVYLIIEEINRGNAAAIFGDLFQLLDRDKKPLLDDGSANPRFCASEYSITNVAIQKELETKDKIVIPSNLTIIGTMNTSDQNVFTLDTAFKRRWEFEQVNNEFTASDSIGNKYVPGSNVTWKTFVDKVNKKIARQGLNNSISDDKRIGKYFVSEDMLTDVYMQIKDDGGNIDKDVQDKAKRFAYKVLEYIWNDVAKFDDKVNWFDTSSISTLEELISKFIDTTTNNPVAVFIGGLF